MADHASSKTEPGKNPSGNFSRTIIARSVATALGLTGAGIASGQEREFALEEIVVTARKHTESTQDVPMHIQSLTGDQMKRQGLVTLEDFSRFVPSLSVSSTSPGQNTITFRGVSDGGGFLVDPTAAIYLDEQPMTVTSQAPDIYPADIARIEALAGPQSTLYGASSQSGTVRYITNKPDASEFSGVVGAEISTTKDGEESYDLDATVNIPIIEDKLAIRLTGFSATDGGFIDNVLGNTVVDPTTGLGGLKSNAKFVEDDINEIDWLGARAQVRWLINDDWMATVGVNYQKIEAGGWNDYDETVGDLETIKFVDEFREDEWTQISLIIEGDLGFAQLVSATSYYDREIKYELDSQGYAAYFHYNIGIYYGGYNVYDFGPDPTGPKTNDQDNQAFTQEIRLSGSSDRIQWTAGVFYQQTDEQWDFYLYLDDYRNSPAFAAWSYYYPGVAPTDAWWLSAQGSERTDMAVFGEADVSITEKIDLILGGRWYDVEVDRDYQVARPATRLEQDLVFGGTDDGFVPKLGLQYNFNDDVMAYALYSEGYRVGGINRSRGEPTLPTEYDSDTLENTEIGIKSMWFDGRFQFNATAYSMEWKDVQLEATDPSNNPPVFEVFQTVVANLGDAEVVGIDIDLKAAITANFEIGFNMTYIDKAEVEAPETVPDDRFPGGEVSLGLESVTPLPLFADLAYSGYAEYNWNMNFMGGGNAYVRLQHSYTGESYNQLSDSGASPRVLQDDYAVTDISLGYATDRWSGRIFVNNLDDERGTTYYDTTDYDTYFGRSSVNVIRPRNAGLSLRYNF